MFTFVCFTPGACRHRRQSAASRERSGTASTIFRLKTPIISTVITAKAAPGGALSHRGRRRVLMLFSTYSVISPEGCASILWKSAERPPTRPRPWASPRRA